MTKHEIINELIHILNGTIENTITLQTAIEMLDDLIERATTLDDKTLMTYFSPFTNLPVMIEDDKKKYTIEVKNVFIKEETK